jgi:hypothetical protein
VQRIAGQRREEHDCDLQFIKLKVEYFNGDYSNSYCLCFVKKGRAGGWRVVRL